MKHKKRLSLNDAALAIAKAFNGTTGIRRTYGGGDDSNRMHIAWQIVQSGKIVGMIDLYCEDGHGKDGMDWGSKVDISAPGVFYSYCIFNQCTKLTGRTAKRYARGVFINSVERIITLATMKYSATSNKPYTAQRTML